MGQHDWNRAVKSHRVIQLVLEHIQVVEPIWISITETEEQKVSDSIFILYVIIKIIFVVDTHSVVLSLRVSACSGMP